MATPIQHETCVYLCQNRGERGSGLRLTFLTAMLDFTKCFLLSCFPWRRLMSDTCLIHLVIFSMVYLLTLEYKLHGGRDICLFYFLLYLLSRTMYACVCSAVNSLQPHGLQPTRLLWPWDFPGKNAGVGCHFFLQGIFPTQGSNPHLLHCRQILYHGAI